MANRVYKVERASGKLDLSGGVQSAVSRLLQRRNEVSSAKNANFNKKIGSARRRDGYEQVGTTIEAGKDGLGAYVYRYGSNNKILAGVNNSGDSAATVRYLDTGNYWTNIITDAAPNTRFTFLNLLDEVYISGYSADYNRYYPLTNFNSSFSGSTTRNVYNAPRARFLDDFQNGVIAMNVEVNGVKYPDRFYLSSPALGAITFVQNDQVGLLQQLKVDSARYLKAGMIIDFYSAGTNSLVTSGLTIISVDKNKNVISFAPQQINLKDNDELWPSGRKGQLSILWNTDYPTPESAEWKRIPPGVDSDPRITAHGKNNNRKLIFTRNSTWKFDGANLVIVSDTVGCIAEESVQNIAGWTIWLHNTGVWGYNDSTGQFKLLSRSMADYIQSINLTNASKFSAGVVGRVYKLSIGEISAIGASTTSTSTSSTSTSSTSSSTSSTSTSSTSTSSTSTSSTTTTTSTSSTSTSSTSVSTSSTSISTSTSSTSISTSTSSTTTTTVASTKQVVRLVYDFDSNIWWTEYHRREPRYQFNHTMNGYLKPYFLDDTGRLFRDETGNLDHMDTIPFEVVTGRDNLGTALLKSFNGCIIESEFARGALLMASVNNGRFQDLAQITGDVQVVKFPLNMRGRDINYKISQNSPGDPPVVDGITTYFVEEETKIG